MDSFYLLVRTGDDASRKQQGTAWLLWPDLVATALHVVGTPGGAGQWAHENLKDPKGAYSLRLAPGRSIAIEPVIYDPRADVALLRLPEEARAAVSPEAFAVLCPEPPLAGDPWHAHGYPAFERGARVLAVGGVVSHVSAGLASNAIQLFVDQGTSVQWGGISGSAAQNAWGEVIGVVAQTVEGIATCNAAPAEAAQRLLRLAARQSEIEAMFLSRLGALSADALIDVVNALEWGWLPQMPAYVAAPAVFLSRRIAQSGDAGMSLALDAMGGAPGDLEALVQRTIAKRPTPDDLTAVLAALADAGGSARRPADLLPALPGFSATVLAEAVDALHDAGWLETGPRGDAAPIEIAAEGARRVLRADYARAALRLLLAADMVTARDLESASRVAPPALRRAMVCAGKMGLVDLVGRAPDESFTITEAGRDLLAQRTVLPGPTPR